MSVHRPVSAKASRPNLLLVALVLALSAVGWFWAQSAEAAGVADLDRSDRPQDTTADPDSPGRAPEREASAALTARVGRAESGVPAESAGPTRVPAARVTVTLQTRARVLPARAVPATCELVVGDAASGLSGTYVAGAASTPLAVRPTGHQLVRFEVDGTDHYRIVRLRDADADAGAGATVLVRRGMRIAVRGRVVDGSKQPLRGASIWLAGAVAKTDKDGLFETAAIPVGDGMPLVVRAEGYAAFYRVLGGSQCEALDLQPIVMNRPSTELRARFLGRGVVEAEARFYVIPAGGRDSRLLSYPLFMPAVEPVTVGRDGIARFPDLPRGSRVRVMVHHPDCGSVLSAEIDLRGKAVSCVLHGAPRPRFSARVVDVEGRAVEGVYVTARAGGRRLGVAGLSWTLPAVAYVQSGVVARTSSEGEFSLPLERSASGKAFLRIEAPAASGLEYELERAAVLPRRFTLWPRGLGGQPALSLHAGAGVPEFVDVVVRTDGAEQGPYAWLTTDEFPISLRRPALVEVRVAIDDHVLPARLLLIDGAVDLSFDR